MDERKIALVEAAQSAFRQGLFSGTSGNLSSLDRAAGRMYITPTSVRYEGLQAEQIVVMRLDGTVLEGGEPSSEWQLHACLYKHLEAVNAVVHTHSPYATAFAVVRRSIPAVLIEMLYHLGGEVPCAPYATPGTRAVGEGAWQVMRNGAKACLLANHGIVAVGEDLAEAYLRAEYVEAGARIYTLANTLGEPAVLSQL